MTAVSTMIAGSPPWADFAFSGLPAGTVVCRMLRQDPDGRWVLLPGSSQRPILGSEWRFIDHGFPVSTAARAVQYRIEPLSAAGAVLPSPPTVVRSYELAADGSSVEKDGAGTVLRRNLASSARDAAVDPAFLTLTTDGTGYFFQRHSGAKLTAGRTYTISWQFSYTSGAVPRILLGTGPTASSSFNRDMATASGNSMPLVSDGAGSLTFTPTAADLAGGFEWLGYRLRYSTLATGVPSSYQFGWLKVEEGSVATPHFSEKTPTVYGPSQQNGLPFAVQAASVEHSQAWLSDPLDPLSAVLVDVMEEGRQAQWGGAGGGLFPPVGGRPPVSSGFRRWRQRDWAVAVDAPDSAARILGMIEDGGVLLLRGDPECLVHPTGVVYINADGPELSWMLPHDPHRRYTIGGVECAPPAILQVVASRTYADDLAEHPTHAASKAAFTTYLARVRG